MQTGNKSGLLALVAMAAAGIGAAGTEAVRASNYMFRGYGKFANDNRNRSTKRYPQMVGSSREEIAEWNRNVKTRQVLRHQARHA